jgi:hypothetical protein
VIWRTRASMICCQRPWRVGTCPSDQRHREVGDKSSAPIVRRSEHVDGHVVAWYGLNKRQVLGCRGPRSSCLMSRSSSVCGQRRDDDESSTTAAGLSVDMPITSPRSLRLGGADLLPKRLQSVPDRYDDYTISVSPFSHHTRNPRSTTPTPLVQSGPTRLEPSLGTHPSRRSPSRPLAPLRSRT